MSIKKNLTSGLIVLVFMFAGCQTDADIASRNLSKEAEMFNIERRVVFYNGITGEYILTIEGRCSLLDSNRQLEVTCKVGDNQYKKHYLGISDNVTYFAEQLDSKNVSTYHYKVVFKPQTIIPDIDLKTNSSELKDLGK